jgi:hypothetical protein
VATVRPILIVGCPRSGTTLLRDLLRAHSRITIPDESLSLPAILRVHGDPADSRAARRLASDLLASSGISRWRLPLVPGDLEHHRSFGTMVAAVYEEWARMDDKPRWGEKTPQYVLDLPAMRRIFPGAQVIHIIRDPCAVTASLLARPWGPATARGVAQEWRRCVLAGRRDGRPLGADGYHELRYEALVAHPEPVLRALCAFLGERYEPQMLRPSRMTVQHGRAPTWKSVEAKTRIVPGEQARDALGARDRAAVAWEAGDLMDELGYGPAGPRRRPHPGERVRNAALDRVAGVRWRLTSWDRGPRVRELLALTRSRILRRARL